MELDLRVQQNDDRAVVHVGGEIDLATCPQLRDALTSLVDAGVEQVVVDLERVTFLDSSGIGVLISTHRRIREQGGSLQLFGPSEKVRRVLELTRVTTVLPICATLDEATTIAPVDPLAPALGESGARSTG